MSQSDRSSTNIPPVQSPAPAPEVSRVDRLRREAEETKVEADLLAETYDDSTGASWFWALLFGPLYFALHGFWGRAVLVLALNFIIIGFLVAPFLAYPAWRDRARKKAEKMVAYDRMRKAA